MKKYIKEIESDVFKNQLFFEDIEFVLFKFY